MLQVQVYAVSVTRLSIACLADIPDLAQQGHTLNPDVFHDLLGVIRHHAAIPLVRFIDLGAKRTGPFGDNNPMHYPCIIGWTPFLQSVCGACNDLSGNIATKFEGH
jgi:hypothetical protein